VLYTGATEFNTVTLIGMCRTNASSQFVDTTAVPGVLSWFNRRPRVAQGKFTANRSTTSVTPTFVEINSEIAIGFLTWAESAVSLATAGSTFNSGAAADGYTKIYVDGAALTGSVVGSSSAAGTLVAPISMTCALGGLDTVTEGYHSATLYGATSGGTQVWQTTCTLTANIMG